MPLDAKQLGYTIHGALDHNDLDTCLELLKSRADTEIDSQTFFKIWDKLARQNDVQMVQKFVEAKLPVDMHHDAIATAIATGNPHVAEKFIEIGLALNYVSKRYYSPLRQAARIGNLNLVNKIIDNLQSKKVKIVELEKSFIDAARFGKMKIVKYFLENELVDVDCRYTNDSTALMFAAQHNHVEIVRYLLSKGADLTLRGEKNHDVFYFCRFSEAMKTILRVEEAKRKKKFSNITKTLISSNGEKIIILFDGNDVKAFSATEMKPLTFL